MRYTLCLLLAIGCTDDKPAGGTTGGGTTGGGTTGGGTTGGGTTGGGTTGGGMTIGSAGNPNGSCNAGVPAGGQLVDTSNPDTVVGTGTPDSCTFANLKSAVDKGGIITFNCGSGVTTIAITATLTLRTDKNTVIDGGNQIQLDGQKAHQIFNYYHSDYQVSETRVTLQRMALLNGKTTPTKAIPMCPGAVYGDPKNSCSQGFNDGEGGAIYLRDGNLTVIGCIFSGNQAATLGPDTGGGAIYITGSKHGALIVGSSFTNNQGANAAAVGGLQAELVIYNSWFDANTATGQGANNDDQTQMYCTCTNNGTQHEIGSGGNGGAVYCDGSGPVTLCGDQITNNAAGNEGFGGAVFFTCNGTLTITDTTISGNTGGSWGSAGNAVGENGPVNITNSKIQGLP